MQAWYDERPRRAGGRRAGERRGGGALARGQAAVRADLQALHEEAVGQVPRGARRVGADAAAVPDVDRRPLLWRRVAGAAGARVHAHLREHAARRPTNISIRLNVDFFKAREGGLLPEYGCSCTPGRSTRTSRSRACRSSSTARSASRRSGSPRAGRRERLSATRARRRWSSRRWSSTTRRPTCRSRGSSSTSTCPTSPAGGAQGGRGQGLAHRARVLVAQRATRTTRCPTPRTTRSTSGTATLAEKEEGVCFVGRLASYKYFNMPQGPVVDVPAALAHPQLAVLLGERGIGLPAGRGGAVRTSCPPRARTVTVFRRADWEPSRGRRGPVVVADGGVRRGSGVSARSRDVTRTSRDVSGHRNGRWT